MSDDIPIARPSFAKEEEREVLAALRSGWVAQGPRVARFERAFAQRVGAEHAVATSSCTTALFLALHSLGIGPGDEVIVPSLSFIASTNAITHCGAAPVFVDVEEASYNIDPERVKDAVGPRTRALLVVDQVGLPAELDSLREIADRAGIELIEDAACAIGSYYRGQPVGGMGTTACFSFHPRKVLCTGEGGMITTDNVVLAERLRRLRHQGMSLSDLERHTAEHSIIESYPEIGYNFRMSDLHAAVGLAQLAKLDKLLARRREAADRYAGLLAHEPRLILPTSPADRQPNYQSYLIRVEGVEADERNYIIQYARERGVAMRRGLMAVHREAPYRDARRADPLLQTERTTDQSLVIPLDAEIEPGEQERVAEVLCSAVDSVLGNVQGMSELRERNTKNR